MLRGCCQSLLKSYSRFLYNYPIIFLVLTPLFLVICIVFSFVPSVGIELPDFSEPTEGFEPRGTNIIKGVITRENTLETAISKGELSCQYQTGTSKRKRRNVRPILICDADVYRYRSIVTVYESGGDLFNVVDLKAICRLEEEVIQSVVTNDFGCPSLSLGTYIGQIRNRTSCFDITEGDVNYAKQLLVNCTEAYFSNKLGDPSSPHECTQTESSKFIKNVFDLLVDTDFLRPAMTLKTTLALSPKYYDTELAREIYDRHLKGGRPERDGVKLVAFDFDNFKFDQFNYRLIFDAVFPAAGLVMVALILLVYTHSILIMAMTIFSVITSVIVAYFIYHQVFRLTFFPFLNVMAFVFLVGIGADDAFVFNDVWSQAKKALPQGSIVDWIEYTLNHAALSMFVTSFTTSAAFYANLVSDITAIRLFGIFAGTSIVIMYALMITWFPAGVVAMEKRRHRINVGVEAIELQVSPSQDLAPEAKNSDDPHPPFSGTAQPTPRRSPIAYYRMVRSNCSRFMTNLFDKWIPASLRGYPAWLLAFLALGIGMVCAVTVSPGLKRPDTSDFQVFASSHILEQYDLKYKSKFRLKQTQGNVFRVFVFFGFKAEDNGNYFNPRDFGSLEYDNSLDVLNPDVQRWFFQELCPKIRNQSFVAQNINWQCYPELIARFCAPYLSGGFPLNRSQLDGCLRNYVNPSCGSDYDGLFFQGGTIKGIGMSFPTNIPFTNEYKTVDLLWSRIREFTRDVLAKAPDGMNKGWATSWLRFFALQENLGSSTITSLGVSLTIAFTVMLLTTMNWLISIYAILTIMCILATTIGSLVIDGWQLNILESIVISVAVGLSVDFTLHYGVAYKVSAQSGRVEQVKCALRHIGPAVTLAALTTFIAGAFMLFSSVLAYFQLGQFLTLVMAISWLFATFFFMSLCHFAGPVGHFGQINSKHCASCKLPEQKP